MGPSGKVQVVHCFIDESGDAGFKLKKGSSSHFVIAMTVFHHNADAEETARRIKAFRQRYNFHDGFEFKFSKMRNDLKMAFLKDIASCPFRYRGLVIDKRSITDETLRRDKNAFYLDSVCKLLERTQDQLRGAKLRIDGRGSREFKKAFKTGLRRFTDEKITKVKFVNSKNDNLIQLSDMIAGSLARAHHPDKPDKTYLDKLRFRRDDLWLID